VGVIASLLSPLTVSVIRDWLPCGLMLLAYWQAGCFRNSPARNLQARLLKTDEAIGRLLPRIGIQTWLGACFLIYLECSYLLYYPLVPLGLGVLYMRHMARHADQFWLSVLPATYLCCWLSALFQTLPPRMLRDDQDQWPPGSGVRSLNLWILRRASIGLNTFPSAHVAASVSASLALLRFFPTAGFVFLLVASSIAIASVVCRYHYTADALLGVLLACASCIAAGKYCG